MQAVVSTPSIHVLPIAMTDLRRTLRLSTDAAEMDVDAIHAYLGGESYWARGIPRETVARAVRNSVCFGVFDGAAQVAFARVITDRATFGYLADVYVLQPYRGRGIARWMMEAVHAHLDLQGLRRWALVTKDAHRLYAGLGWTPLSRPERHMERTDPAIYTRAAAQEQDPRG
jgi:GNAT superfamily N-acetyltransferase